MGILDTPMEYDNAGLFVPRSARSRADVPLRKLFVEDFRSWPPGMWNDGLGDAWRDSDITFGGRPTVRLETLGAINGGATNPGRTAATNGVVFKRRIHDGFTGIFGLDMWFRFTGGNNNGVHNPLFSLSVYNRTGTDTDGDSTAHHGRLWIDPNGNNKDLVVSVLDGAATAAANAPNPTTGTTAVYTQVDTSPKQNGAGSHTFDVQDSAGRLDRAGGWHYAYLAVDLKNDKYVACKIDGQPVVDLSAYDLDITASTGFAGMHFSCEYSGNTSTPRYMSIATPTGYGE